ncbi:MAG: hypothetical protein HQ517_17990 [SAR324 cluster bacterium]|nr:hypothetical protein [SAR324 cluster bacterium]
MKIEIHELAAKEFNQAIDWYDLQSEGLGKRFQKTVVNQLKKVKKNPDWFLRETDHTREILRKLKFLRAIESGRL